MVEITAKVEGMMCGNCEAHVNEAVRENFKVKKVTSSHKDGETVIISENEIDAEKLKTVIEEAGYKATGISTKKYEKKGFFHK